MDRHGENQQQDMQAALDEFEASVEVPFVPGEMERWIAAVESAWNRLHPHLTWLISVAHPQQYAEIRHEDPELIRRVELMQQEDQAIRQSAAEMDQSVPMLKSAITNIEPDEARLEPLLETFVGDALKLVIRVRTQEQAVRTWFLEAFTRDRGTVD